MLIINKKQELISKIKDFKIIGKTIGLVPTMGYLHEGHLSLVHSSKDDNDITIVSIFVNPTQFGVGEDLESYPRDFERDCKLLDTANVDIVFAPASVEMYGEESLTEVNVRELSQLYCGISRPTHFKGVATVIAKLLNIASPDRAYFGEKDFQQVAIIGKMVKDLDFQVDIRQIAIVREDSGLALSSRNTYLSKDEKQQATAISKSLIDAKELILKKGTDFDTATVVANIDTELKSAGISAEYIKVVDPETLQELTKTTRKVTILIAARVGRTRLIDNISIDV